MLDMTYVGSIALLLTPVVNRFGVFIPVKDDKVWLGLNDFGTSRCFGTSHNGDFVDLVCWMDAPWCSADDGRGIESKVKERECEAGDE